MAIRPNPAAVFIDVGGPIYPDETFVVAVTHALDDMLGGRGAADRRLVRDIDDRIREQQNGSFRTALATEVLGDAGLRGELHERTRAYWQRPAGSIYPDVLDFLRDLPAGITVGVLANQEASVIDALWRDGVGPYIDVWGVSAAVGFEKPSPELFQWALEEANTVPERAVHIGNRLDNDVRPARELGLGTVWVLRGDAPDEPTDDERAEADLVVDDLTGLAALLTAGRR